MLKILTKSAMACHMGALAVQTVRDDFELASGERPAVVGMDALRLHKALMAFLSWIARNNSEANIDVGPSLISLLKDYILKQGWPNPSPAAHQSQTQEEQRLRANAYETIGTLARVSQLEHKAKDALLKWLFDSLASDSTPDIVVYIESALSSMMGQFKSSNRDDHRDLEVLLIEYMTLPERQGMRTAKHIAARFANNCLPYNNTKARWINILALSGDSTERRDIIEEGQKGLDPWWATRLQPDDPLELPDWTKLVDMLFDTTPREVAHDEMALDQTSTYPLFPDQRLRAFPAAIKYTTQMLTLAAIGEGKFEIDWETQLERRLQNDLHTRATLRTYLAASDQDSILRLLGAALDGLRDHPETGAYECIRCLAHVLPFAPTQSIVKRLSVRAPELLLLLKSNSQEVRQLAAGCFGVMAPWCESRASLLGQLHGLWESGREPSIYLSGEHEASLAFVGHYLSHAALYSTITGEEASSHVEFLLGKFPARTKQPNQDIQKASIEAAGRVWTVGMGFPGPGDDFKGTLAFLRGAAESLNEQAILALGRLVMSSAASGEAVDEVMEVLFGLTDVKRTEVHFAIGEALAAVVARWDSKAVQLSFGITPSDSAKKDIVQVLSRRSARISLALDRLIAGCKATKPSLLKASGIWLFCIIEYCCHLEEVQSRLRECQVAFMRLLSARDELVQETASRGLALVYEKGDPSLKGDLIKDLVATFTGTKTQLKVSEDTELFEAGALPTGEGKSVTSYKDIINLANEVGDQSLVYKFMALATNAATWTARSAFGRFGLSSILSDAELDPKIYPKLYRYRFDPNSNVRRSMDDIWKAVVKDQTAVLDAHFDAIMDDLLKSILDGREWRVREASCAAVSELTYGQPFAKYEKYYADIWKVALRVLDDQKGSVRTAALKLCLGLSKSLVTQLQENNRSSSAKAMLASVLPFLLSDKGVENSAREVQVMAIVTVLDVVKHGGDTLKPFIPDVVGRCLGLLGTVEPEQIGYYYQRLGEEDREQIDKSRSSAATQSPLFECVVNCLRFVDETVMKELAPLLIQTIKSAIGMQTKVGCSETLATLALRHSIHLMPHSAAFLKAMELQILDRNNEVSKAYARSSAYLLRAAPVDARDRFTSKLTELYFTAQDETRRQKVADAVLAIAKISQDAFTHMESLLLPLAYVGKHDTDSYVSEEFSAVWAQHAGGDHTVMRFLDEIANFVSSGLGTSQWALQHGAALTMASLVTALANVVGKGGQFSEPILQTIWPRLDKSLALKTFPGKEKLVTSFPIFVRHGKGLDSATVAQTKKIAMREAKRNNEEYRPYALEALAAYAREREDVDMYAEASAVAAGYLASEEGRFSSPTALERSTTAAALKVVMSAYSRPRMQSEPAVVLAEVADTVEGASEAISTVRDTWSSCATSLLTEAATAGKQDGRDASPLATRWSRMLTADEAVVMVESQRAGRAQALGAFAEACNQGAFGDAVETVRKEARLKVSAMAEAERSLDVQKLLKQAEEKLL